ncbi:MAG: hypothetical protein U1F65_07310 [Verrucomicrobiota bacterium]
MNEPSLIPVLLLILLGVVLGMMAVFVAFALHLRRRGVSLTSHRGVPSLQFFPSFHPPHVVFQHRPPVWLAIRSRNLHAVQSALGLLNPRPCSWIEGIVREQKLFIAPPVNGWILVVGSGLPEVTDDVDETFRFLLGLSRKVGQVQYFAANRVLGHHAWAMAEAGRIVRAYAWAGQTLWNQGVKTRAELELGLKCYHYFEGPGRLTFGQTDVIALNTEKVPLLAARWSLDPASIDERLLVRTHGIAEAS